MSQSLRRKATRRMYKKLKKEGRLIKPTKQGTQPLPPLTALMPRYKPKIVKALTRVIDFEMKKPGEFGKWLEDLHIEHFRAGFQERIEKDKERDSEQETRVEDCKEQTAAETEVD